MTVSQRRATSRLPASPSQESVFAPPSRRSLAGPAKIGVVAGVAAQHVPAAGRADARVSVEVHVVAEEAVVAAASVDHVLARDRPGGVADR
ncbi:hypothetical protein, partial [Streptomyces chartreusis]|uniref:hypothetical protein n=1 Tax=Streptomyces chartreusis TaxID=1969 RepID=UPI003680A072